MLAYMFGQQRLIFLFLPCKQIEQLITQQAATLLVCVL